jgi:hypothetical protein
MQKAVHAHVKQASHIKCTTLLKHESSVHEKKFVAQRFKKKTNQSQSVTFCQKHKYQGVLWICNGKASWDFECAWQIHSSRLPHTIIKTPFLFLEGEGKFWMKLKSVFFFDFGWTYTVFSPLLSPTLIVLKFNFNKQKNTTLET